MNLPQKRIVAYLSQQSSTEKLTMKAKKFLYRFMPGLDFHVKQYQWKEDSLSNDQHSDDESSGAWVRISNRSF